MQLRYVLLAFISIYRSATARDRERQQRVRASIGRRLGTHRLRRRAPTGCRRITRAASRLGRSCWRNEESIRRQRASRPPRRVVCLHHEYAGIQRDDAWVVTLFASRAAAKAGVEVAVVADRRPSEHGAELRCRPGSSDTAGSRRAHCVDELQNGGCTGSVDVGLLRSSTRCAAAASRRLDGGRATRSARDEAIHSTR